MFLGKDVLKICSRFTGEHPCQTLISMNLLCNSINTDKTKWTVFHPTSKKRFLPTKCPELFIDGKALERETMTKFLGVFIHKNAVWKAHSHINTIFTKIFKNIGILYRARLIIPRKQLNQL